MALRRLQPLTNGERRRINADHLRKKELKEARNVTASATNEGVKLEERRDCNSARQRCCREVRDADQARQIEARDTEHRRDRRPSLDEDEARVTPPGNTNRH